MSDRVEGRTADGTAYEVIGHDGPVVALIHGLGLCRRVWDGLLPAFAGYRVLNYDLFGHGDSAAAPRKPDLGLYSDQLAGVLGTLGMGRAHVVGFSIGGMINRRFAMDYPALLGDLVILNSPHDRGTEGQAQVEARAASVRDQGAFSTFDAALKRWFTPDCLEAARDGDGYREGTPPDLVRHWRGLADPESYAGAAWVLAHGVRELIRPDPPIPAPTLVVTCENDTGSTPAMSEEIAREIKGARLDIVPGLQHLGLMEEPMRFADPIRAFLERT